MSQPGCELDSCCFYISLEVGCYLYGIISSAQASLVLVIVSVMMYSVIGIANSPHFNQCKANSKHCLEDAKLPSNHAAVLYCAFATTVLVCLLWLFASWLLIAGARKRQIRLIRPWLVCTIFEVFVYGLVLHTWREHVCAVPIFFKLYGIWVVISFILKVKKIQTYQMNPISAEDNAIHMIHRVGRHRGRSNVRSHQQHRPVDPIYANLQELGLHGGAAYMTVLLPQETTTTTSSHYPDRNKLFVTPPPSYNSALLLQTAASQAPQEALPLSNTAATGDPEAGRSETPPPTYEEAVASAVLHSDTVEAQSAAAGGVDTTTTSAPLCAEREAVAVV